MLSCGLNHYTCCNYARGHLTSHQKQRINSFLKRARKFEFTESIYCIEELLEKSDTKLFGRLTNPAHCLYPILPGNNKSHEFLLRKKGIHLPSPIVLIICINTPFCPVVFRFV